RHVQRCRHANLGNGLTEDALNALARGIVPPRECDASTRRQGSHALRDSKYRSGKMCKPGRAVDSVKETIEKWKLIYVTRTTLDPGIEPLRHIEHRQRAIRTDRSGAAICGFGCKSARPARDIQKTRTGAQMHGAEKRIGG